MIGYLSGSLLSKKPEGLILDVGGVGYAVSVPLSTYYELPEAGEPVQLRIHTYVRDDAIELYGFRTDGELSLFNALRSVTGIGPKLAVTILSGIEPDPLAAAIVEQDIARLTTIPGVGTKTAERLALELKDKVRDLAPALSTPVSGARDDVLSALLNLGYKRRDAERALKAIEEPAADFDALLRQTLRMLAR